MKNKSKRLIFSAADGKPGANPNNKLANTTPLPIADAHMHVHPDQAAALAAAMDANELSGVVNAGIIERLGLPFESSMRAFRDVLGNRMAYLSTPDWSDTSPLFGERMAEDLERKGEGGASGLKIFKELAAAQGCKYYVDTAARSAQMGRQPVWFGWMAR